MTSDRDEMDLTSTRFGIFCSGGAKAGLGHLVRSIEIVRQIKALHQGWSPVWFLENECADLAVNFFSTPSDEIVRTNYPSFFSELPIKVLPFLIWDCLDTRSDWVESFRAKKIFCVGLGGSGEGLRKMHLRFEARLERGEAPLPGLGDCLLGLDYLILRPEVRRARPHPLRNEIKRVFIGLGGDSGGLGQKLANVISSLNNLLDLLVVQGPLAPLQKSNSKKIQLLVNPPQVWELMSQCDLVISSGGMTTAEALCMGIPCLLIPTSKLQIPPCRSYEEAGLAITPTHDLELWNSQELGPKVLDCIERLEPLSSRRRLQEKSLSLIDGLGAERVAKRIVNDYLSFSSRRGSF